MSLLTREITERYGTLRGLVRLALSYGQAALLPSDCRQPAPGGIARLVFVCQGNICRSAYAEAVAQRFGLHAASFGLATDADKPAHPPAAAAAALLGYDLSAHRTTRAEDFTVQPGDLLLAMEIRQLTRLAADPRLRQAPRSLLGFWGAPPTPHLHDPFGLDDRYMLTCLKRIERAVANLANAFPATALSSRMPTYQR